MNTIKSRIAKLEGDRPNREYSDPVIISWNEDPSDTRSWASAWVAGPTFETFRKQDDETKDTFAALVDADVEALNAGIK